MRKLVTAAVLGALVLGGPALAVAANGTQGLTLSSSDRTGEEAGMLENFLPVLGVIAAAASGGYAASKLIKNNDAPTSP